MPTIEAIRFVCVHVPAFDARALDALVWESHSL